ncbi:hypothetical protein [Mesorhizobium sp. INR15]|uniref:hypothetical protein n=1 Tax=Mesorhizobium sp. INR15 TaxID=2654248 RepID=UPI0035BBA615
MSTTPTQSHLYPGIPLALASAALFGATPPLSKLLLNNTDPFMLARLGLYHLLRWQGNATKAVKRRSAGTTFSGWRRQSAWAGSWHRCC